MIDLLCSSLRVSITKCTNLLTSHCPLNYIGGMKRFTLLICLISTVSSHAFQCIQYNTNFFVHHQQHRKVHLFASDDDRELDDLAPPSVNFNRNSILFGNDVSVIKRDEV